MNFSEKQPFVFFLSRVSLFEKYSHILIFYYFSSVRSLRTPQMRSRSHDERRRVESTFIFTIWHLVTDLFDCAILYMFYFPSCSLHTHKLSQIHTHTYTYTYTHTHSHIHPYTHSHTQSQSFSLFHSYSLFTHTHTISLSLSSHSFIFSLFLSHFLSHVAVTYPIRLSSL